ncbi:hypothetical protein AURDEDRAFT_161956 [Auricularia subglabra TFB-10046 SS5]|nr:hypothetical protein AURDEDRAFT_161956 [Auricularia subglabra TFB-10046 SS5]
MSGLHDLHSKLLAILAFLEKLPERRILPEEKSRLEQLRLELLMTLEVFKLTMNLHTERMLVDLAEQRQEAFTRWVTTLHERSRIPTSGETAPSLGVFDAGRLPPVPVLFGRDRQFDDLVARVFGGLRAQSPARLVLLGTGGVGKSSLALAVLHDAPVVQSFCDRRVWLSCEGATTFDGVIGALAAQLSVAGKSPLRKVAECLGTAPTILVLDNFETPWEAESSRLESEQLLASLA